MRDRVECLEEEAVPPSSTPLATSPPVEVERVVYEERIVEVAPDPNRPLRSPRPSTLDSRRR